jgi:hypothetical protein
MNAKTWFNGYQVGIELLLINGLLTFLGLLSISTRRNKMEIIEEKF